MFVLYLQNVEYMKVLEKKEKKEIQLALTKLSPIKKKKPKLIEDIEPPRGIVKDDKWCNTEGALYIITER